MLKTAAIAAFVAFASSAALAADITGNYRVEGKNLDGSPYAGSATIVATTKNTCRITWDTGSTASGICMRNDNAFAAGYVMDDVVGLVIYEIMDDGSMEGIWTIADQTGVGTERLIPTR